MANLSIKSVRWQRYEPDLPGNRELPRPFYFEIAADLSKEQFRALQIALDATNEFPAPPADETLEEAEARRVSDGAELCRRTAVALAPYVRFGTEPLTLDGVAVTELVKYLEAASGFNSKAYFVEVASAVTRANTLHGVQALFSERLSGGFVSTASRRNG